MLYEKIYKTLHLENWLYNKPDDRFIAITINPIDTDRLVFQLKRQINKIIQEELENEDNFSIER